jgi:type IV pilus modification protein PilV
VLQRLRIQQDGFGLVEVLIALVVLSVGILAILAGFSSAFVSIRSASATATAATIADQQMERFRAIKFTAISLNSALTMDATYKADIAYTASANGVGAVVFGCATTAPQCTPTNAAYVGADGATYRVDTYIRTQTLATGSVDLVTVVVDNATGTELTREQSTFTAATGS